MKLLRPYDQIDSIRSHNNLHNENPIPERGVCSRLAAKWGLSQLAKSPFDYDKDLAKTSAKQRLKNTEVIEKLKERNVDTEGLDPKDDELAWRGGRIRRNGRSVMVPAYRDQLFASKFTTFDKKKYSASVKREWNDHARNDETLSDMDFLHSLADGQSKSLLVAFFFKSEDGTDCGHRIAISNQRPRLLFDPNYGVYEFESSDIDGMKKELDAFIRDKYPRVSYYNVHSVSNSRVLPEVSRQMSADDALEKQPSVTTAFLHRNVASLPSKLDSKSDISSYQEVAHGIHDQLRQRDLLYLKPELSDNEMHEFLLGAAKKLIAASQEKIESHSMPDMPEEDRAVLEALSDLNKDLISTMEMAQTSDHQIQGAIEKLKRNQESISEYFSGKRPDEKYTESLDDDNLSVSSSSTAFETWSEPETLAPSLAETNNPLTFAEEFKEQSKQPTGNDLTKRVTQWLQNIPSDSVEFSSKRAALPLGAEREHLSVAKDLALNNPYSNLTDFHIVSQPALSQPSHLRVESKTPVEDFATLAIRKLMNSYFDSVLKYSRQEIERSFTVSPNPFSVEKALMHTEEDILHELARLEGRSRGAKIFQARTGELFPIGSRLIFAAATNQRVYIHKPWPAGGQQVQLRVTSLVQGLHTLNGMSVQELATRFYNQNRIQAMAQNWRPLSIEVYGTVSAGNAQARKTPQKTRGGRG